MANKNRSTPPADLTQPTNTPQTTRTKKDGSPWKTPEKDTRPPTVIFADRVDEELRLISRRFARLEQIGNSRNAEPTEELLVMAEQYLREGMENAIRALRTKLDAKNTPAPGSKDFSLLRNAVAPDGRVIHTPA
jgi:hypothetical protein